MSLFMLLPFHIDSELYVSFGSFVRVKYRFQTIQAILKGRAPGYDVYIFNFPCHAFSFQLLLCAHWLQLSLYGELLQVQLDLRLIVHPEHDSSRPVRFSKPSAAISSLVLCPHSIKTFLHVRNCQHLTIKRSFDIRVEYA